MFVIEEARLDTSVSVAQARLSNQIGGSRLMQASEDAHGEGVTGLPLSN